MSMAGLGVAAAGSASSRSMVRTQQGLEWLLPVGKDNKEICGSPERCNESAMVLLYDAQVHGEMQQK